MCIQPSHFYSHLLSHFLCHICFMVSQVLNGLHYKGVSSLCWGGQAAVGVGGRESYLVSCSLDRTLKVIGVPTA